MIKLICPSAALPLLEQPQSSSILQPSVAAQCPALWGLGSLPPAMLPEGHGTQTAPRSHSCWSCDSCWSCAEGVERAQSPCRRTRCRERRCEQESLTEPPVPGNAWLCLAHSPPVLGTWPGGFPNRATGSRICVPRSPQMLRWLLQLEIEAGAVPGLH